MTTVPNCARLEANEATYASHMAELVDFFTNNSTYWSLLDSSPESAILVENGDGERGGVIWNSPDMQAWIDPLGDAESALSPGGTAGSDWSGVYSTDTSSDGDISYDENSIGVISHVIELPDAVIWLITNGSGDRHIFGLYIGKFATPFNASDLDEGLDIYGVLLGNPGCRTGFDGWYWVNGHNTNQGITAIRAGSGNWTRPTMRDFSLDASDDGQMGGSTGGRYFWAPFPIQAENGPFVGVSKYIRSGDNPRDTMSVTPSSDTDQAWLHVSSDSITSALVIIWNKTVTP